MVAGLDGAIASPREVASEERRLRRSLGVPDDARTVLVFGETSHWDPNWLFTSEEYYQRRIATILDEVLSELEREPRRVFSIESLFFLQRYWERRPERRELVRELVRDGRLRFTGTGVTTPDTLLPSTEAILRDYLHGQEWLRENGMEVEPRVAYLPDDFGHSPALPSILSALGFDRACVTRIDGMYFVGTDYRGPGSYPLPGSSAHLLYRELSTTDFVWRGPDGAEVLCHWNAFTYFQGDMLAHIGVIRWMGVTFGIPWRTGRHIAGRIDRLVAQLAPRSRSPYLFCPIGCDFNGPIPDLLALLDRYNRTHFQDTGVWVVNAGMDDHLALVDCHRGRLPVLSLDPNPYWMGFYASRPDAKRRINRTARKLVLAEKLAFARPEHEPELRRAWDLVVLSNHHDFITGTSPDRVFREEQLPWLREAEDRADAALARVIPEGEQSRRPSPRRPSGARRPAAWRWRRPSIGWSSRRRAADASSAPASTSASWSRRPPTIWSLIATAAGSGAWATSTAAGPSPSGCARATVPRRSSRPRRAACSSCGSSRSSTARPWSAACGCAPTRRSCGCRSRACPAGSAPSPAASRSARARPRW
ncbi:MAG: hypothetical protein M5U28_27380 [Sandaracinaceae bacterium]|nr:hypothetical protein [Sandaracinaceae bacterium]